MMTTIFHIVYIHGFQGDHTTFQSFPTDLHHALQPQIPAHVELRSVLYPTYESKRPIAVATQNFLNWLEKLPLGPVVLCGHSMGGLLAAEAATSPTHSAARRVVALLAYDVPFLGMHPHVVISGIASLLPQKKGRGDGLKSEREMNDARHVHVPREGQRAPSPNASHLSLPHTNPSPSQTSLAPPPLPPRPSSRSGSQTLTTAPATRVPSPRSPSHTPAVISRTLDFLQAHADDPLVTFITQHRTEPIAAAKRWVVESFEFGICMFDPKGLKARYDALERWRGEWVAFWTETVRRDADGREVAEEDADGDGDRVGKVGDEEGMKREEEATASLGKLLHSGPSTDGAALSSGSPSHPTSSASSLELSVPSTPPTKTERGASVKLDKAEEKKRDKEMKALAKADKKRREKELKALRKQHNAHSPHHFIVRPFRAPVVPIHRWEHVKIRGAKDEVEAHCGLFLRDVNWEYEAFVGRVAEVVKGWVGLPVRER